MKYAIVIPDGAADHPLPALSGKTAFEAADTPNLDRIARLGIQGTVRTTPEGKPCGSDICSMCLLGYAPEIYHTGRAPLEAAALGLELAEQDWIFRVNLITVADKRMKDHSAGAISNEEGQELLAAFAAALAGDDAFAGFELHPGVSYRNIMVDKSGTRDFATVRTTPPHDVPGDLMADHLPIAITEGASGSAGDLPGADEAALLSRMVYLSEKVFHKHPVNEQRLKRGQSPATHVWPWGQGRRPSMPSFEERFGLKGAMITAVDLLAGIAAFIGWDRLDVPGQTSYHDTDYEAAGQHGIAALDHYDIVCVHVEAPDEASHQADAQTKVAAISAIDKHVIGPVHKALEGRGEDYRILVLPDHYTAVGTRKHDATPPPFAMCGAGIKPDGVAKVFTEASAGRSKSYLEKGHELMDLFLGR